MFGEAEVLALLGTVIPSTESLGIVSIRENSPVPVPSHAEPESKELSGEQKAHWPLRTGHGGRAIVQPGGDVASQTTRPSAEVTPGPASPSFVLGKGWHTAERKYDPQKPGQEEPLGQMLKENQVSGEGTQGQAAWLRTFFQQE